jgi:phospho-N-acetylmuramoyl-pentapeptide-transferase
VISLPLWGGVPFPSIPLAFLLTLALGVATVPLLRRLSLGQVVRSQGPARHLAKAGTPTGGGVTFLVGTTVATLLTVGWDVRVVLALGLMWAFGLLGAADDLLKVWRRGSVGLRARDKLLLGTLAVVAFAWAVTRWANPGDGVPWPATGREWTLGPWILPFWWLVIFGSANAVNLTDGLDGLAAGLGVMASAVLAGASLAAGQPRLAAMCLGLGASLLAFLVFNWHPARVFMGDVGSLGLGAALAAVAVLTRAEWIWLVAGGVFVAETLSVMLQVASFRLTGRRIFRMSPLHHHLELGGRSEVRVVATLWAWGAVCAAAGLWALR